MSMRLEMGIFPVSEVVVGKRFEYQGRTLTVDANELRELVLKDGTIKDVSFHAAMPGDSVRITNVLDAVEPLYKVKGRSGAFPGFLGSAITAGDGRTHKLGGMCVISSTYFLGPMSGIMTYREGIIDMSGPGERYCTNSETANLVARFEPLEDISNEAHDDAVRLATLKVASRLAECTAELEPVSVETFELGDVDPALPRVVFVDQVMHQASMVQTFMYGKNLGDSVPTLIHPNEMLDGAVVGANYKTGQKVPTYIHCNMPLIYELYRRHGVDLNFVGMIITRGHHDNQALKERSAHYVAKLATLLKADGAALAFEGGGNSSMDYWLTVQALEQMGVSAVPIIYEVGRPGSGEYPLVYHVPEADAIISKGMLGDRIEAPAMERVIGSEVVKLYGGKNRNAREAFTMADSDYYANEWAMDLNNMVGKAY
ncbi:MAG: beta-aspartyl-peptidase [Nitrospinaceae bacterium]|jgi:glycine reductase complex component B subunit alpha and beta|nr:beta-aspartyl-peptidase [Nitrospinaceae bacterium]MBT3435533.1 beta-aspartyl-peptidase [Nitrospinaceae bacterium]MBT3820320.1 beta-aspartyl-peptidase [Nitrospinaceae bacterium]MBT4094874.1 beta-aspartyl-peptidase [Nitrospinaceae bacterium]MBT4430435.1 beta-aspartyl-peptidase [Nitrospinaceae bacterium]